MKRCPKCRSSRIRRGYAHDLLIMRMVGFRELLCDSCNLRFRGFVLPGTLPKSGHQRKKQEQREVRERPRPKDNSHEEMLRPGHKRCPVCESQNTHRSHRRGVRDRLASTLGVYPYRCEDCNNRFLAQKRELAH